MFDTQLDFQITVIDPESNQVNLSRTTGFNIDWGADQIIQYPDRPEDLGYILSAEPKDGVMRLGQFRGPFLEEAGAFGYQLTSATTGPNAGYGFLSAPRSVQRPAAAFTAAFQGIGKWYQDQNGVNGGNSTGGRGLRYCTAADFPGIDQDTRRHEGVIAGAESHYDVNNAALRTYRVGEKLRRLYFRTTQSDESIRTELREVMVQLDPLVRAENESFHARDEPRFYTTIGCEFDMHQDNAD